MKQTNQKIETIILDSYGLIYSRNKNYINNLPCDLKCLIITNSFILTQPFYKKIDNLPPLLEKIYIYIDDSEIKQFIENKKEILFRLPFGCKIIYFDDKELIKCSIVKKKIKLTEENKKYFNRNNIFTIDIKGEYYNNKMTNIDKTRCVSFFNFSKNNELVIIE